ncbi:glutamine synthetase family protein [Pseudarthrobacter sp. NKDBFgelt]|uniref:glutamine synthetase family protein n=1 Tax=Pseudarthrobacter sp. NKDBFgelt TaxID=3384443 RepID=UPI0038D4D188
MTTWTDIVWIDILGRAQTIRRREYVPGDPIWIPRSLAAAGHGAPSTGGPLLRVVPDVKTLRDNVLEPGAQLVMADLQEADGSPSELCSRTALRKVLDSAVEQDLDVQAAVELECYLLDPETLRPVYEVTDCYGMARSDQFEAILAPLRNDLPLMGIAIEASNLEYSGGQIEVNLRYGPALQAADNGALLRLLTRRTVQQAGLEVTFMAKPWTEHAGSGMHIHQSLWRYGQNLFANGAGLSDVGHHYVAGLLGYMSEFTLLGSPTVNAYHRRSDGSFAPTVISWGSDNRTLAVRCVVGNSDSATRVEQRDAAADCNIHIALAGQIAAGLEGIRRQGTPPKPITGNAYAQNLERLPRTFLEAYEALQQSSYAREALGQGFVESYLDALSPEIELLLGSCAEWERSRYLGVLVPESSS